MGRREYMKIRSTKFWTVGLLLSLVTFPVLSQKGPQDNWVIESDLRWGSAGTNASQFTVNGGNAHNEYGSPWGIAVAGNRIYVADAMGNRIKIFGKDGSYISQWGSYGSNTGQLDSPHGLACDGTNVYVSDMRNGRIQVFNTNGVYLRKWGSFGTMGIAVDTQNVFAADCGFWANGTCRVLVFDKGGNLVREWGGKGSLPGQFQYPTGIAVDRQYVYVVDAFNTSQQGVQVFTKDGNFIRRWPLPGGSSPGWYAVYGIAVDDHNVYVANAVYSGATRFRTYDKYGSLCYEWTNSTDSASLQYPTAIAIDTQLVYVTDSVNQFVQPFRRIYKSLGGLTNNTIPLADVLTVSQRPGTHILDVDYSLSDADDTGLVVYATASVVASNSKPSLACFMAMRSFVDGTATNIGTGISTAGVHRISWDMDADNATAIIGDYGPIKVNMLVKDSRDLLDIHFLSLPASGTNPAVTINGDPLQDGDFLTLWFWWLAAGDTNIVLTTGTVFGVSAPYVGASLAYGTNTTSLGRDFIYSRLSLTSATPAQIAYARMGLSNGSVTNTPRREPPPTGSKVNDFNFVISPTNGWWVVPLPGGN